MNRIALFDLDGTLLDSAPDIHSALDRLMAAHDRPGFSREEVRRMRRGLSREFRRSWRR